MTDLMSIAYSGVRAYQTALSTVSDNIANASTPGYARRTTQIGEVAAATDSNAAGTSGMGAVVQGITRSSDAQSNAAVRDSSSDLAKTETSATWLSSVQSALTGYDLSDQLTSFFDSAKAVAADPSASAPRETMLESASTLAATFTSTGQSLASAASDLDSSAQAAVTQLNTLAAGLARVNSGLSNATPNTSGQDGLLDQRDQLLEQMSAISDVTVSYDSAGRATVNMGGSGGPTLVQGDTAGTVTYSRNDAGSVSYALVNNGTRQVMSPTGGALAGYVEGASRIAAAQTTLNGIASSFASSVNAVQANGSDLNGNAGAAMFATGNPPTSMTMVLSDPNGIAAAATGGGSRDNSNLMALESVRQSQNFEGSVTNAVSSNAATLSARQSVATAQTAIHDNAVSARDAVSGVNIDEEAVDLMRFQQAYSASSRVIQVARDTLASILQIQ